MHLRQVGYHRKVAKQTEAQKGGNVTETPSPSNEPQGAKHFATVPC